MAKNRADVVGEGGEVEQLINNHRPLCLTLQPNSAPDSVERGLLELIIESVLSRSTLEFHWNQIYERIVSEKNGERVPVCLCKTN